MAKSKGTEQMCCCVHDNGRFKNNFRLINQIDDSAGFIMDNIAEGFERSRNKEFLQFLYIAKCSFSEFRSQLYSALNRTYITPEEFHELYELSREIIVMLQKLIDYLEASDYKGSEYKNRNNPSTEET